MPTLPPQTIVDTSSDAGLSSIYPQTAQQIPISAGNSTVYITNKIETVTNIINQDIAGGQTTEVQFNIGDRLVGDSGFTYDADTDSLSVAGNITVAYLKTNNLLYANGSPWSFGGASYANSNVANYLPVYNGNMTANNFAANTISGNGSGITFIAGGNVSGTVANSAYANAAGNATTAGTVTTGAQPNITSVGTLTALTVTGTTIASLFSGSGANLTNLNASNISGAVASATAATTAGTVTTQAQPNITSVGTLASLAVTGNVSANFYTGNGSLLTGITATTAQTVTSNAQPNITSTGTLSSLTVSGTANTSTINSNGIVTISNTTASTNTTSGALIVAGGIGSTANIHGIHIHAESNVYASQRIYAGQNAIGGITFSTEVFVGKTTSETFIQTALINSSGNGSADYTSFGENGDDTQGWTSLGMSGTTFNDPDYTITDPSDGYVLVQGMTNQGGNLVLATGDIGDPTHRDIVFATGGFLANNERFRYSHSTNTLVPYANATLDLGNAAHQFGNVYANKFIGDGSLLTGVIATASLPIANGSSNIDIATANSNITITSNGTYTWNFSNAGNFYLAEGNSLVKSVPNNAGDGSGLSTLNLYPDSTTGDDRYLIVDPTGPNHIHIRAGGAQDASNTLLFLGGEQAFVQIDDTVHEVKIGSYDAGNTATYFWTFENDGTLTAAGDITTSGNISATNIGNISATNLDGNSANVLTGTGTFTALPVINANTVVWSTAPVANTSTGTAGQAAYDAGGNLYVCVATDTWAKFTGTTSW